MARVGAPVAHARRVGRRRDPARARRGRRRSARRGRCSPRQRLDASPLAALAPDRVEVEATLREDPRPGALGWHALADVRVVRAGRRHREHPARDGLALRRRGTARRSPGATWCGSRARCRCPTTPSSSTRCTRRAWRSRCARPRSSALGAVAEPVRAGDAGGAHHGGALDRGGVPARARPGCSWASRSATIPTSTRASSATSRPPGSRTCSWSRAATSPWCSGRCSRSSRCSGCRGRRRSRSDSFTVAFIVVLTGAEPSVMRAGTMTALTLVGPAARPRPLDRGRAVGRGAGAADPAAGAGALDRVPALGHGDRRHGRDGGAARRAVRARSMPAPVAAAAGTTLAAQLGVTPILLFHFHDVPGVTLLANVVAAPTVAPSLLLGLVAAAAASSPSRSGISWGSRRRCRCAPCSSSPTSPDARPSPTSPRAAARSCSLVGAALVVGAHRGPAHRVAAAAPGRDRRRRSRCRCSSGTRPPRSALPRRSPCASSTSVRATPRS